MNDEAVLIERASRIVANEVKSRLANIEQTNDEIHGLARQLVLEAGGDDGLLLPDDIDDANDLALTLEENERLSTALDEIGAYALTLERGNAKALQDWYTEGAKGQINWGRPGDFDRCVQIAGKYVSNPQGFCQLRHIEATGAPAGKAPGEKRG